MLREIKKELKKGPTSTESLSAVLGVSAERIGDALGLLLNMGIIEEVPLLECRAEKSMACLFCPLAKSCGKTGIKIYRLTSAPQPRKNN